MRASHLAVLLFACLLLSASLSAQQLTSTATSASPAPVDQATAP